MSFIFPAKSFTQYKLAGKEIIIIGEEHTKDTNQNMVDVDYTWDFIANKVKDGYTLNLELGPQFHKRADEIIKHLQSVNIRETLKRMKKMGKLNQVNGMDFRKRGDFFGIFGNDNIQAYFFDKSKELLSVNIWQFLVVMDNIMTFTNKHFYNNNNIKNLLLHLNKDMLDQISSHHKNVDAHSRALKQIIQHDAKGKPQGFVYKFQDMPKLLKSAKYPSNLNKIVDNYRDFVLIFSDILTLVEMLYKKEQKHILLIGDAHAQNFKHFLRNYITYPYNHPKMSTKDKKLAGKEVRQHVVYKKFLK